MPLPLVPLKILASIIAPKLIERIAEKLFQPKEPAMPEILGVVRHVLTAIGGAAVAKGYIDAAGLDTLIGAFIGIAGVAWSIIEKRKRA